MTRNKLFSRGADNSKTAFEAMTAKMREVKKRYFYVPPSRGGVSCQSGASLARLDADGAGDGRDVSCGAA
ncbi:MAG: hypothetical protein LBE74_05065 [Treponema sp.]|nr:hypothetical protein [Treponema sp.]